MDQLTVINGAVVIALMLLGVSAVLLVCSVLPLMHQSVHTLASVQRLSETLNTELPPTLTEVREVLDGVNQIRALTAQRVTDVGTRVEAVSGSVGHAVTSAHKESAVWGAGLWAGLRTYLKPKPADETQKAAGGGRPSANG